MDPIVGVAITISPYLNNTHTGILYRDAQQRTRLLHLRFHYDLHSEPFDGSYICVDLELEIEDAKSVAQWCQLIANDSSKFPVRFAINYNPNATLRREQGRPVIRSYGKGLNCATFVIILFKEIGINLVNFDRWPKRPRDAVWHKRLLEELRKHTDVSPGYFRRVERDVGCARVRPEEVAGAGLEYDLPASFAQCEANGVFVLEKISQHTGLQSNW